MSWVKVWGDVTPAEVLGLSPPVDKHYTTTRPKHIQDLDLQIIYTQKTHTVNDIFKYK